MALLFFTLLTDIGLPSLILSLLLACYGAVIALTWWRSFRQPAITEVEFFSHLLVDILFFTALLYFSGGASNPFISYYLVPISIAAATLPIRYTWITAALSLIAYSFLMKYYLTIPALLPSHHHHGSSNLHLMGMWFNFLISAGLITYFVTEMAKTVQQQEELLAQQREDALRDDQVLAIGTLAAGTAHELGTPLNTMKVLIDEMLAEDPEDPEMQILQQQIQQCRQTLKQLVQTAEDSSGEHQAQPLNQYFSALFQRWQVMRPRLAASIRFSNNLPEKYIRFHPTIAQSLLNLLNNAADASPEKVDVSIRWDDREAILTICDDGPGLAPEIQNKLGQPITSEKPGGTGLGIFLAKTSIERLGGSVRIDTEKHNGTRVTVRLPLTTESRETEQQETQ